MNPELLTLPDDMSVAEAASFLLENEISGAPVEDQKGEIVGVVSLVDIVAASLHPDGEPDLESLFVADIMSTDVEAVGEDATVSEVATTMLNGHIHRLLVTRDGNAIGLISTSDLLGLLVEAE